MEKQTLIDLLIEEGYPTHMIDGTVSKLDGLTPQIKGEFSNWLNNGANPTISVAGYSYDILVNEFQMKPVGAFLTLDWLTRDSESAVRALKKGYK